MEWSALPLLSERKVGSHLRLPTYEGVIVPEETAPVRYVASEAAIREYCYAVGSDDRWYREAAAPFGFRLAPSAMVLKELMWLYQTQYDRAQVRGFHQHEDVTFHRPVPAGAQLVLTGRNTEKFTKRGKGYFRHVSEARDLSGQLYVSQVNTEIIDLDRSEEADDPDTRSSRRLSVPWDESMPTVSALDTSDLQKGTRLEETRAFADRAQTCVFSGIGDGFLNLHTSRQIAAEMGFSDLVVQGLMNVCWLSEELTRKAGLRWLSGGRMSASFLKPMLTNHSVRLRTVVAASGHDGIELETSFVNEDEQIQAVAISTVPRG